MAPARASIVVPLFNKVELTRACVASVVEHTAPGTYELVLVDNASTDETPAFCASLPDDVVVIRNEENLGFARASNQGAEAATGDHLVFLNNDTEVHEGWLEPLLDHLDAGVGAVGSKLLFPDGTVQHCGVVLVHQASRPDWFTPVHWKYGAAADDPEVNETRRYQVVTAACMGVRRDAWTAAGAFHTGYWNGYEDVDLCLTIGQLGFEIVYEPTSVVTHFESASGPERFRKVTHNEQLLMDRWLGRVTHDVLVDHDGTATADPEGVLAHMIDPTTTASAPADTATTSLIAPEAQSVMRTTEVLHERETTLEVLELARMTGELERRRGTSDVVWLEGEDPEPLVTIRIATYNRGQMVVDRAVASALAQTYRNIEVLVVGDACDDATTAALSAVDDPRVRFVRLPTRGLYPENPEHRWMVAGGHPMVTALDLARGSWIAPCDDDDELTPDHVEVLLGEAKRRRLEMVWSIADCETPNGRWRQIGREQLTCGHITHGSVMYSLGLRDVLPNVRSWRAGEPGDWNLWRRMHNLGVRMGFVDQITYIHYAEARHRVPAGAGSPR